MAIISVRQAHTLVVAEPSPARSRPRNERRSAGRPGAWRGIA
jgi:hypothetical protein